MITVMNSYLLFQLRIPVHVEQKEVIGSNLEKMEHNYNSNLRKLATLLEGAGYLFLSSAIEKLLNSNFWWIECEKLVSKAKILIVKCSRTSLSSIQ